MPVSKPISKSRPGLALFLAFMSLLPPAAAGELSRPIPPEAQVTRFTRFNLRYSLRDIAPDSIRKIEFFITEDMGRTWRLYGEDPDLTPPMTIEVPGEGVYGFVSVATDRFGNRERPPVPRTRPETVIVVDRTPPQAKWLAPQNNILGRGRSVELAWEASDPFFGPAPVKMQYAADARSNHDRDAVWSSLQDGLPASGRISWAPPGGVSGRYNFRLIAEDRAGNLAVAYCPATVTVDNAPPSILSVGPLRSNKLETPVAIEAEDGPNGSGLKEICLYVSSNSGAAWTLLKEKGASGEALTMKRASGQPFVFTAPRAGDYALWPVAFDEAGNATPLPTVGSAGPYVLVIDNEPPVVNLQNSFLMGRSVILANESRSVSWTAYDPHILSHGAAVLLSLDAGSTWQELRSGLPSSGTETIYFPFGAQSEEARLKVTAADEFGNIGESVSASFKLTGAETVIASVTPAPREAGGEYPWGGDGGQPPSIPPPPILAPAGPGYPPPAPDPEPPAQAAPPFVYDRQPLPPDFDLGRNTPLEPPPAGDPNSYPFPGVDYGGNESAAGPLPRAILSGGADGPPRSGGSIPPPPVSGEGEPAPPLAGWTPTPGAANQPPALPAFPSVLGNEPAPPGGPLRPPDSQPASPMGSIFDEDWQNMGGGLEPPPFPTTPGTQAPEMSLPEMGSIFDGFPPLSEAPPAPAGLPPSPPAAPGAPPFGGSGDVLLPPIEPPEPPGPPAAGPPRTGNPRQLSEHHVSESKRLLDDGQLESALDEATQALNADGSNYRAYMALSQVYAKPEPRVNNFARAATLAKEATSLGRSEWDAWWNCADIFYRWAHRRNLDAQALLRTGQRPPVDVLDERNQALNNAQIAVGNSATLAQNAGEAERKKVAVTQGLIAYLRALTLPEPAAPAENAGPAAQDEYRRNLSAYKAAAAPVLSEALPYFQAALRLGAPAYSETFHIGIINFRLAGLEKDGGNLAQAATYYQEAARYLDEATTAGDTPPEGPREAYYMLAYCHDLMGDQPGPNRARNKELALRYWRQTAEFYAPGTPYREYAVQRIETLSAEMGR